jgi:hypothetical protein
MSEPQESPLTWLAKKYFDECSLQFRTVWDLYLKFYIMFLTVNGAALGLTVQYVYSPKAKAVIALAFVLQNVFAAGTAAMISEYSFRMAKRVQGLAEFAVTNASAPDALPLPSVLGESPLPGQLGRWGGIANLGGHVVFVVLWFVVIFVDFSTSR